MQNLPRVRESLFTAAFAVLAAVGAEAQESHSDPIPDPEKVFEVPRDPFGLGVKKVAYSVALKVVEEYDDNILLEAENREADWVTATSLKARVRYEGASTEADLEYQPRDLHYARHDEFNGMEHVFNGSAKGKVGRMTFEPRIEWRDLKEPFDVLQVTERMDTRRIMGRFKAAADFERWDLEATAGWERFQVDDDAQDAGDYERWSASVAGVVQTWPETSLIAEFVLRSTDYQDEGLGDFVFASLRAGIRGALSAKIRGEAFAGLGRTEFRDSAAGGDGDFSGLVLEAALAWTVDEQQEVRLDARREPIESLLSGLAVAEGVRLSYRNAFSPRWIALASAAWDHEVESDDTRSRMALTGRGALQWTFHERYVADLAASLRSRSSADTDDDYENFRISLGVGIQW